MARPRTYSFTNIAATITGPGGTFSLGSGSGNAEEGITVEMHEDKDTLVIGADGTPMHNLHAGQGGKVTIRLLKTSPVNQQLSEMYAFQRLSSANWGQNTIVVSDTARGDVLTLLSCAFMKFPSIVFGKDGGTNEWVFNAGQVEILLGSGSSTF